MHRDALRQQLRELTATAQRLDGLLAKTGGDLPDLLGAEALLYLDKARTKFGELVDRCEDAVGSPLFDDQGGASENNGPRPDRPAGRKRGRA